MTYVGFPGHDPTSHKYLSADPRNCFVVKRASRGFYLFSYLTRRPFCTPQATQPRKVRMVSTATAKPAATVKIPEASCQRSSSAFACRRGPTSASDRIFERDRIFSIGMVSVTSALGEKSRYRGKITI